MERLLFLKELKEIERSLIHDLEYVLKIDISEAVLHVSSTLRCHERFNDWIYVPTIYERSSGSFEI